MRKTFWIYMAGMIVLAAVLAGCGVPDRDARAAYGDFHAADRNGCTADRDAASAHGDVGAHGCGNRASVEPDRREDLGPEALPLREGTGAAESEDRQRRRQFSQSLLHRQPRSAGVFY